MVGSRLIGTHTEGIRSEFRLAHEDTSIYGYYVQTWTQFPMALQAGVDQRIPVYWRVLLVDVAGNYYGIADEGMVATTIPGTNHPVVACKNIYREQIRIPDKYGTTAPFVHIYESYEIRKALSWPNKDENGNPCLMQEYNGQRFLIDISVAEFEYFSQVVEAEAGREPHEGKLVVVAVIVNCVLTDYADFKNVNTMGEVLRQRNQFEPVMSGIPDVKKPSEETYRAVVEALTARIQLERCSPTIPNSPKAKVSHGTRTISKWSLRSTNASFSGHWPAARKQERWWWPF